MSRRANLILALVLIGVGLFGMSAGWALDAASRTQAERRGPEVDGRESGDPRDRGPGRGGGGRSAAVDAMFIERMIPHHDEAIAMAELAATRAEHAELKRLAARIARTQRAENEQMRAWYDEWYGGEVPERGRGPSGMMMGEGADLERLERSEDFDRDFIEMMVPHHRMAIMMARMVGSTTRREEMRDFAAGIERTQSEEIELMLGWYEEWYGR